jgi:sulfur-oxidizing protein SoxX
VNKTNFFLLTPFLKMTELFSLARCRVYLSRSIIFSLISLSSTYALSKGTLETETTRVEQGEKLAFDRKSGNCLACHAIGLGTMSGNLAPPLFAMKERFPNSQKLTQQISNSLLRNEDSIMPPFGLHGLLNEEQISKIVDYLYTL